MLLLLLPKSNCIYLLLHVANNADIPASYSFSASNLRPLKSYSTAFCKYSEALILLCNFQLAARAHFKFTNKHEQILYNLIEHNFLPDRRQYFSPNTSVHNCFKLSKVQRSLTVRFYLCTIDVWISFNGTVEVFFFLLTMIIVAFRLCFVERIQYILLQSDDFDDDTTYTVMKHAVNQSLLNFTVFALVHEH